MCLATLFYVIKKKYSQVMKRELQLANLGKNYRGNVLLPAASFYGGVVKLLVL